MKRQIFTVVTILSLLHHEASANPVYIEAKAIWEFSNNLLGSITGTQSIFDMAKKLITGDESESYGDVKKVLLERLDSIEINIPEDIQEAAQIDDDLREMFHDMGGINYLYKSYFRPYLEQHISNSSLQDFIKKATSSVDDESPERRAVRIFNIIHPAELGILKSSFLDRTVQQLNSKLHHSCRKFKSPQRYIYELYLLIAAMEYRAYIMSISAFKLRSFNENDGKFDVSRINQDHNDRMTTYLRLIKNALTEASKEVSRCSPTYTASNVNTHTVQLVSLADARSTVEKNMVITGIRFVVKDLALNIQIEEGKLIAGGDIQPDSTRWLPVEVGVDPVSRKVVRKSPGQPPVELEDGVGYRLALVCSSFLHLANVTTSCTDCVLVAAGLRLNTVEDGVQIFYLTLTFAKADMKTGEVSRSFVKFEYAYDHRLRGSYPRIGMNDLIDMGCKEDDWSVAYFDSNSVFPTPRLPLSGVGTYRVSDPQHGNAAALRVFNYDISTRIKTQV